MQVYVKAFEELSPAELYAILRLRVEVFMLEQKCLYPDLDGLDRQALHVWLSEDGELAAYLRLLPRGVRSEDVMIGRVIAVRRGCGLGAQVMREGIRDARERLGAEASEAEPEAFENRMPCRHGRAFGFLYQAHSSSIFTWGMPSSSKGSETRRKPSFS